MCIVAVAWQLFTDMPLVLFSNRDEYFNRPTLPAHQWQDYPLYASRDQRSGGAWLGFHRVSRENTHQQAQNKRWATVLNFRDGSSVPENAQSRGALVQDFLSGEESPMEFAKQLQLHNYAGFNLIIGNDKQAVFVNNRGHEPMELNAGLHVFSNGSPSDEWFKCEQLRKDISMEVLPLINLQTPYYERSECPQYDADTSYTINLDNHDKRQDTVSEAREQLDRDWHNTAMRALQNTTQASVDNLPVTGLATSIEQVLSSVFIPYQEQMDYGTRTHSILQLTNNKFSLIEKHIVLD